MVSKSEKARQQVFEAALTLAAQKGWRRVSLSEIAEAAGTTLADLRAMFGSKLRILEGFAEWVDEKVLAETPPSAEADMAGETVRDRLFDILMRRFDVLQPYKDGIAALARDMGGEGPAGLLSGWAHLVQSMEWMLEAAGAGGTGPGARLRAKALAALWVRTAMVWLRDNSEDMAQTMAALDRNLAEAERWASRPFPFFGFPFGPRRRGAPEHDVPPPEGAPPHAEA